MEQYVTRWSVNQIGLLMLMVVEKVLMKFQLKDDVVMECRVEGLTERRKDWETQISMHHNSNGGRKNVLMLQIVTLTAAPYI